MSDDDLYPDTKPYHEGFLKVSSLHNLHYARYGTAGGIPIVYLHGGPGSPPADWFHRMFDPAKFDILIYSQRGTAPSQPLGETHSNNPDILVRDLETLREHCGFEKMHVYGGSWGSTLALLYAERYPERTMSLTLRGVWTMRNKEIPFLYNDPQGFFPEATERYLNHLTPEERADPMASYFNRISGKDHEVALAAAREMYRFQVSRMKLEAREPAPTTREEDEETLGMAKIEVHFLTNCKLRDRIWDDLHIIRDAEIPTMIVQGRYDFICPPEAAYGIHKALPQSDLQMVTAGHSSSDPAIKKALRAATDRIRDTGTPCLPDIAPVPPKPAP